jgi:hypothetical protein
MNENAVEEERTERLKALRRELEEKLEEQLSSDLAVPLKGSDPSLPRRPCLPAGRQAGTSGSDLFCTTEA